MHGRVVRSRASLERVTRAIIRGDGQQFNPAFAAGRSDELAKRPAHDQVTRGLSRLSLLPFAEVPIKLVDGERSQRRCRDWMLEHEAKQSLVVLGRMRVHPGQLVGCGTLRIDLRQLLGVWMIGLLEALLELLGERGALLRRETRIDLRW